MGCSAGKPVATNAGPTDSDKAFPGEHRSPVDLQCKCKVSWKFEYFFENVCLGFVCQECWKEWLLKDFVQVTKEEPVCVNGITYLSPDRSIAPLKEDSQFQVNTSRKKIIPDYAADCLKRGDHIMWHKSLYWHHAIVEEVNGNITTLIEYKKLNSTFTITCTKEDVSKKGAPLSLVVYSEEVLQFNPVELALARARSLLGLNGYHLLNRNCENFATFCKTGINSNQQKKWLTKRMKDILSDIGGKNAKQCINVVSTEFPEQDLRAEGHTAQGIEATGAGFSIAFEGYNCFVDLEKMYQKRKETPEDGELGYSRKDFMKNALTRISSSLFSPQVLGSLSTIWFPWLGPVAAYATSTLGSSSRIILGHVLGEYLGPKIGRAITNLITDDRPVRLQELHPGDHIVCYGNLSHPRCHCIVLSTVVEYGEMTVIRFKYNGGVVNEVIKYDEENPPLKIIYPKDTEKYSAEEIVERAVDAMESYDKKYHLVCNNCEHFACYIILKA